MKIYELQEELAAIEAEIDAYAEENHGLIPDNLLAKLNSLELEKSNIIEGVYKSIKNRIALAEALDSEVKKLQARAKKNEKTLESLKILLGNIVGEGNKYANGLINISWRLSKKLIYDKTWEYPETFYRIKTSKELSVSDLKAYIEEGGTVENAEVKTFQNIQIK